ncbi:RimK family alpha-L-glutamate ligase [Oceanobacillus sp. J11TS1]|uniref:RimK family alpha-L-glutamate ligase n=1 Tax=Oceanobacillus sp. J11TS1 TaxID=2807191 RepID=UPI001B26F451|nr:RimK family alpha-L-glutamate ligase [Oceanobacillus sp. J11TS1]GIO21782.1 alpha-L-glutamate ligase [Oceanobacillus sp. J11TS1]
MNYNGWIIINGSIATDKFLDYAAMVQEAAAKQDIKTICLKNDDVLTLLCPKNGYVSSIRNNGNILPDFAFFIDKDIYLARQLEQLGVRVFNSSKAIEISDDKIYTYQILAKHQLPIPKTIIAPKKYNAGSFSSLYIQKVIDNLGFPLIIKEAFGSFGEQVHLINNKDELTTIISHMQQRPFLFQAYIEESKGRDIRVQVVGDKAITAVERQNSQDFRANVTNGGRMLPFSLQDELKELAVAATQAIGADFAGVDLLFGQDNTMLICEINANAHIRNLYECTGINAADHMITYIKKELLQ